ncbi:MAG: TetR/AcrR family transcriptional regulator [Clostridia bacterium]
MNRDEKNLQTREKIVGSALREFSEKSYGEASLNTVCAAGNISKGIIYHYFKDKDELYLACVRECFDALTGYLANVVTISGATVEAALERYFDARIAFFAEHPHYLRLFCNAIMNPPAHLLDALAEITADFDALNLSVLTGLLSAVNLRPGITVEEVVAVFREYQDFVNTRFQMQAAQESTLKEHEERCRRSLKILLYGIIERER